MERELNGASGIRYEKHGPVATVTLRQPESRDTHAAPFWHQLRQFGRALTGDVRVVVVRAESADFSLSSTHDGYPRAELEALARQPDNDLEHQLKTHQEGFDWLRRPDLVSVAAVGGRAGGPGCQLALACDLRVVSDDVAFAISEIRYGLVPALGGTKRLVELVGYARALEWCLTARAVRADEAYRTGLAAVVVPRGELDAAVADLVSAVLEAPRAAVTEVKALLTGAAERSHPEQLAVERAAQLRRIRDLADLGE